jgi:hypothetical protein
MLLKSFIIFWGCYVSLIILNFITAPCVWKIYFMILGLLISTLWPSTLIALCGFEELHLLNDIACI